MALYHLAQLNIAKMKTHLEHPSMEGFVSRLDEINGLAESSPGFIWRLKDEPCHEIEVQVFNDPRLVINLTVWEDIESLRVFTYKTAHAEVMRQRKKWFEHLDFFMVLWWISKEHIPTLEEAKFRLQLIEEKGPTEEAFIFSKSFQPPVV